MFDCLMFDCLMIRLFDGLNPQTPSSNPQTLLQPLSRYPKKQWEIEKNP
jgi:hypothetical protein